MLRVNNGVTLVRRKSDIANPATLNDLGTQSGGVSKQNFVELGAPHLVGERHGFVPRVAKFEGLGLVGMPRRDKFSPPFLHANGFDGVTDTQLLKKLQVGR